MLSSIQDQKSIFRLSALIYNGNNYNIKNESIIKKIIESIFIDKNELISIFEALNFCEENYGLNFTEDNIKKNVLENSKTFIIQYISEAEFKFKLAEKRYKTMSGYKDLGIDEYINLFIDSINLNDTIDRENIKELIYKYLYEIFTSNLNGYEYFIHNKDIYKNISVVNSKYSSEEIQLINDFLNYDNPEKNKAIFNIVSLSLEYCILTGNENQIYVQGLNDKVFYLDTNVLYRAIGIHGEERKESTLKFIKKCMEINIEVKISKYTETEFENTLNYYVLQFSKYNGSCSNVQIYEKYNKGKDIYNLYCEWRCGKENNDLSVFKAHIKSLYEKFKKEYKIVVDYGCVLNEKDEGISKQLIETSNSIGMHKSNSHLNSDEIDAKNFILIKNLRGRKQRNNKLLETKYFLISTDQKLRDWNYSIFPDEIPIIFLPSQWLAIILRFVSATNDDYNSFVSFLNMKKNESLIESDKLQAVLSGIAEITDEIQSQEFFAKEIIEDKVIDIINIDENYKVFDEVRKYVKESMDEMLSGCKREIALGEEEIVLKEEEIASEKDEKELLLSDNKKLKKEFIENSINLKLNKWSSGSIKFIGLFIFIIFYITLHILFENSWFNFVTKIYNWVGQAENRKLIVQGIDTLICFSLSAYSIKEINGRLNKKSKRYQEKYNEYKIEAEKYVNELMHNE